LYLKFNNRLEDLKNVIKLKEEEKNVNKIKDVLEKIE